MTLNLFRTIFSSSVRPFDDLPGPTPTFPIGNLWDFLFKQKRPWEVVAKYGERYGRMSVFWIFNQPAIVLNQSECDGGGG